MEERMITGANISRGEGKRIASIGTIKKRLKAALDKQGNYIEGVDALIEITAGNLYTYYLALRDVEGLEASYVEEVTREGNTKSTPHPAIKIVREQSEMLRRCLRELRLTIATVEGGNGDDIDNLINTVDCAEYGAGQAGT
jgi:hypothetical protein